MRRIFKFLAICVFCLLVAIAIGGMFLPGELRVEGKRVIQVPKERVVREISDLRQWTKWLPMFREEPAMKRTYAGTPNGVGMVMSWDSKKYGNGQLDIYEVSARRVILGLQFNRQGTCTLEWKIDPAGPPECAEVTLHFLCEYGQNYAGRYMGLFAKKFAERQMEETLENLKEFLESPPPEEP